MNHHLHIDRKRTFIPLPQSTVNGYTAPNDVQPYDVRLHINQASLPNAAAQRCVNEAIVSTRKKNGRQIVPNHSNMVAQRIASPAVSFLTPDVDLTQLERIRNLRGRGQGKVLVIVANGPSINEVDLSSLKGHPKIDIMSINKPDKRLWPTDLWAFCDASVWQRHQPLWDSYTGTAIVSTGIECVRPNSIRIKALYGDGFSRDLTCGYYIGHSTVFASMQTALWMNYDSIFVFGVDMAAIPNADGTKSLHFYGVNPDVDADERISRFALEAKHYDRAAESMSEADRARFKFCSSYNQFPFVDKFVRLDHRAAASEVLKTVNK